jgi:hypothetical protein
MRSLPGAAEDHVPTEQDLVTAADQAGKVILLAVCGDNRAKEPDLTVDDRQELHQPQHHDRLAAARTRP